ncbi:MAG: heterocyst differentiation protein HetZ [Leptolyngbyaceae cyanobacterium bins.302]|nr:heterocyst differentiation protein HetZ [Leptolyngbyaceae cyanobacterium bins.302]
MNTLGEICQSVEPIFRLLLSEFKLSTSASEQNCQDVADRISKEVHRICTESKRIQASGEAESWALTLAKHRLQQCLHYYKLGSERGRVELASTLSAVVYRYITPPQSQSTYQARLPLIEDFLQLFLIEAINAFRRENQLPATYQPRTMLELAEYMAFTERYAKRRIPLPGNRTQQLIILRAQTFSQQQPIETPVDIEQAAEGMSGDAENSWSAASMQQVREQMVAQEPEPAEDTLRQTIISELIAYLDERNQSDCADYFILRLQDLPASEIEAIMNKTPRERDYLQQRFKYHLIRFALSHRWELVHQWLEADLEKNLGLTLQQWQIFVSHLDPNQQRLLQLKQQKLPDAEVAQLLGCSVTQVQKQWFKLLEHAWEIRNYLANGVDDAIEPAKGQKFVDESGEGESTHE